MNKKIKIAHVLHAVGGVDVYLKLVTENIDPDRFENVIVYQQDGSKKKYVDRNGKSLKEYKIPVQREINVFKDCVAVIRTVKILKKEKPHIIHAHSAKGGIIARAASLFYKVNVLHTPHAYSFLSAESRFLKRLYLFIEKVFKNFNSILLATSESERRRGIDEVKYSEERALRFDNSIFPIDNTRDVNVIELPDKYLCTVSRPSYQKNVEMMVWVVHELKRKIPDIHLVIMGVGEYSPNKENIIQLIENLELTDNVTLIKWMERDKILSVIKKSLLYISTSRYEGLPYSVIESLALSKACVVTDCDGNKDLIVHEFNGFLTDVEDVKGMVKSIERLYFDDQLRKQFEKNAFTLFNEKLNMEKNISELEKIYTDLSL
ncbi:glycosyltransferase [Sinomicrobium kalidii]|uniref:glycosyltransferase n=1 Tax=Sinomicrobium kalidii TaxID=2900738 RepID=UPI001E3500F9|nr:glycosyltransferase [Sinomicrobium kalidii]UGU17988.1 glycosyltransferase [Sinomicrobium kalidii]